MMLKKHLDAIWKKYFKYNGIQKTIESKKDLVLATCVFCNSTKVIEKINKGVIYEY